MAKQPTTSAAPKIVSVTLSHPYNEHEIGAKLDLERLDAKRLVAAGVALYSTKADAQAAEGERGVEKTVTAARQDVSDS